MPTHEISLDHFREACGSIKPEKGEVGEISVSHTHAPTGFPGDQVTSELVSISVNPWFSNPLSTKRAVPSEAEGRLGKGRGRFLGGSFELVAQRVVIAALQPAFLALALPRLYQVLQTAGALGGRFAALGAAAISLHPQLVLTLARNREVRELVLNRSSHC